MENISKNIEHVWTIICSGSTIDQHTNNISMFNLVEKISANLETDSETIKNGKKILMPFNQEVITRLHRTGEPKDLPIEFRVDIVSPDGKLLGEGDVQKIAFAKKFKNMRFRVNVANIPVIGSGTYRFVAMMRNVGESKFIVAGSVPIEIEVKMIFKNKSKVK